MAWLGERAGTIPGALVDGVVAAAGLFWLASIFVVYVGISFTGLLWLTPVLAVAIVATWVWLARGELPTPGEATETPGRVAPAVVAGTLALTGAAYAAWWTWDVPFWIPWVATLVHLLVLAAPDRTTAPTCPPALVTRRDAAVLALAAVAGSVFVAAFHAPQMDDAYYVNAMISALEHPDLPLLSFDGLHGDTDAPIQQLIHRPQTYEVGVAVLSALTGMDARTLYWLWVPTLLAPFAVFSWWRVGKLAVPTTAWLALPATMALWFAWGDDYRTYGAYSVLRFHHGKSLFICFLVPTILYLAGRYSTRPSPRAWVMLCLAQCAAACATSSALVLAPVAAGVALLAGLRPDRDAMKAFAAGLVASLPLVIVLLLVKLELSGVGGLRHDGWERNMTVVLGKTVRGPLALFLSVALASWVTLLRTPGHTWVVRYLLAAFALVYNDMTAQFLTAYVADLFSWRLYWVIPVPLLAGVALGALAGWRQPLARVGGATVAVALLGVFWTAGPHIDQRKNTAWKWWSPRVSGEQQEMADLLVAHTEPSELALATTKVAEQVTQTDGRPRLVAVRESYLTNLGRHWSEEESAARFRMWRLSNGMAKGAEEDQALADLDTWCVTAIVVRKANHKKRKDAFDALGFELRETTKQYALLTRPDCTR